MATWRKDKQAETQRRAKVVDRMLEALFQDHRQLPKRQQQSHPRLLPPVFVLWQQSGSFGENLAAIDGSKFKVVNNRDRYFTCAKLKRRMEKSESSISRYLAALDTADRQEPNSSETNACDWKKK